MRGALEAQMFDDVREPAAPRGVIGGADMVADVDRDQRDAVHRAQDHLQPVG